MKTFLSITAFLEGITGVVLILVPQWIVYLLFSIPLEGTGGMIAARIAGIAIIFLALLCWFSRNEKSNHILMTSLLFYNLAIIAIFLDAFFVHYLSGFFFWLVVLAHTALGVWGLFVMRKH
ncbi:MAG TPA: hypothetical protein VIN10_09015 [Bacteroidales bacterium]